MKVDLYISGMGLLSPQGVGNIVTIPKTLEGEVLKAEEPSYENYIAPALLRRMSRVIKMGVSSGLMALKAADCEIPDGIITGTGYGCLEDTDAFITKLIRQKEVGLNPTPFIQSTHNTIGAQLALMLKCYGYNQTYSQGGFSFEQALLDASLWLKESPEKKMLVLGVDELIPSSIAILQEMKCFYSNVLGEGAASFLVTGKADPSAMAKITRLTMLPSKSSKMFDQELLDGVDLILSPYEKSLKDINGIRKLTYGDWVGEYPVRMGFALSLGVSLLQSDNLRDYFKLGQSPRKILIHHIHTKQEESFLILESCLEIP
jgi:3-oxoacyl-[acyl-carrier-protein] synthase II